jgi:predicted dehydrogenase
MSSRILVCGLGSIGKRHLANVIEASPHSEIAILRTQGPMVNLPRVLTCFQELDKALDFCPEVVIIASPASLHVAQAIAFSECANRILIEKPISTTLKEARHLQESLDSKQCRVIVGYNLRYFGSLQRFREFILEGKYGRLIRLEAHVGQHLSTWRADRDPSESVSCRRDLGGGVFRELSHEIDYCLWICGLPHNVRARKSRHLGYGDAEDCVDLWMEFPGGAHAALHMDMIDRSRRRTLRAICQDATIELDFMTGVININGKAEGETKSSTDTYKLELEDLLHGRTEPLGATYQDGVSVLEVIEAAEEDAQ